MSSRPEPRPITGKHVAAAFIAFFSVIIAVNFTMAGLASHTWTGLVVKNSYVASQNFNSELEKARKQSELGWSSRLVVEPDRIVIHITDRDGAPVILPQAKLAIGHPAHEHMDRTLNLVHQGRGIYSAMAKLTPGLWSARLDGGSQDTSFRQDFRFTISTAGADS